MPLNEPNDNTSITMKWDTAESAMKTLMCAEDIKARITHHRHGGYSVTVVSNEKELANDVFIAPLQKKEMMQRWAGKVVFEDMNIDELSEFYVLAATSADGVRHEAIVKIETSGMPAERDKNIVKGIIKTKNDFYRYIELMLTDAPWQYISSELLHRKTGGTGNESDESLDFPNLYEKMLRIAATNPKQIYEIGALVDRLGDDVVPSSFSKMYKQFVNALN